MEPPNNQMIGETQLLPQVIDISSGQSPRQSLIVLKSCGWKTTGTRKPKLWDSLCSAGRLALREGWGRLSCKACFDFCVQRNCWHCFKEVIYVCCFGGFFLHIPTSPCQQPASATIAPLRQWGLQVFLLLSSPCCCPSITHTTAVLLAGPGKCPNFKGNLGFLIVLFSDVYFMLLPSRVNERVQMGFSRMGAGTQFKLFFSPSLTPLTD